MYTGSAKAAVARRTVRYLLRGDTGALGPDADGDVARMLLSRSVAPGATGGPEERWLALWLHLCRCTAPALPAGANGADLRESSRAAVEPVLKHLRAAGPGLVPPGTSAALAGRGPLPSDHRIWAVIGGTLLTDGGPDDLTDAVTACGRFREGLAGRNGPGDPPVALALAELLIDRLVEAEGRSGSSAGGPGPAVGSGWPEAAGLLEAVIARQPAGAGSRTAGALLLGTVLAHLVGLDPRDPLGYRPTDPLADARLERGLQVLWEAVVYLPDDGDLVRGRVLIADLLVHRYLNGTPRRRPEDLTKAIGQRTAALTLAGALGDVRVAVLHLDLSHLFALRAHLPGQEEDLDRARFHARLAVELADDRLPGLRAVALSALGLAESNLFQRRGGREDLDDAVAHLREACTAGAADRRRQHPGDPEGLNTPDGPAGLDNLDPDDLDPDDLMNLTDLLVLRHERSAPAPASAPGATPGAAAGTPSTNRLLGAVDDLGEARACAEAALAGRPSSPNDFGVLCVLSTVYLAVHRSTGDLPFLQAAVLAAATAAEHVPADHPAAAECHSRWAAALYAQGRLRLTPDADAEVDRAIALARTALALAGTADRPLYEHDLAVLLDLRGRTVRSESDLLDLVALHRELVSATPDGSPWLPGRLHGLQTALCQAAGFLDDPVLLAEAVPIARRALALVGPDDRLRAVLLTGYAHALRCRAEATLALTAEEDTPPAPSDRSAAQGPESAAMTVLSLTSLGDAADAARTALALAELGADGAAASWARAELVRCLLAHARHRPQTTAPAPAPAPAGDQGLADVGLREAAGLLDAALAEGSPAGPLRRHELQLLRAETALLTHRPNRNSSSSSSAPGEPGELPGLPASGPVAVALRDLAEVAGSPGAPLADRLVAAERGARLAMELGDPARAHRDYRLAVDLLRRWTAVGLDAGDVRRLLADWQFLGPDAAAAAIAAGDPVDALALLEECRAVLWQRVLDLSTDLAPVAEADPELALRLRAVAAVLRSGSLVALPPVPSSAAQSSGLRLLDADADRLRAAETDWATAVAEARILCPGFLDRVHVHELCARLPGTVVVVNISRHRCDALLVGPGGVHGLELSVTLTDVKGRVAQHLAAEREFDEQCATSPSPYGIAVTGPFNRALGGLTAWLWDSVAAPVLDHLAIGPAAEGSELPRLWWCPTGGLALLPLHAAGRHARAGESVLDRVVPSYTPTVAVLASAAAAGAATARAADGARGLRMLAVLADRVANTAVLPGADAQRSVVAACFPDATVLDDGSADSARVLSELPGHQLLHVMCHGHFDRDRPELSGLVLTDGILPLPLLARGRTDAAFVSLTACRTATVDPRTADEVISTAAAMAFAGWRQAVATLWPVDADETTAITTEVYRTGRRPGDRQRHPGEPRADEPHPDEPRADEPFRPEEAARLLHRAVLARRSHTSAPQARLWAWAPYIHLGP
ncbi:CHAT domain-containing protein [Kitasatospora sp. NPDC057223]|uniref:CHAT domain-containing protein n=1 Tax=Kitasatospora sp. NPDC057223 TaxID=3346055 RepID=UPI00363FBB51